MRNKYGFSSCQQIVQEGCNPPWLYSIHVLQLPTKKHNSSRGQVQRRASTIEQAVVALNWKHSTKWNENRISGQRGSLWPTNKKWNLLFFYCLNPLSLLQLLFFFFLMWQLVFHQQWTRQIRPLTSENSALGKEEGAGTADFKGEWHWTILNSLREWTLL